MSRHIEIVQIVARSSNNIIGNNGDLPWRLKQDLQYFKENTLNHVCIVGRKTYDTIKHLKDRKFIVISRSGITRVDDDVIFSNDIDTAIAMGKINAFLNDKDKIFIIGGAEIYRLSMHLANTLLITEVHKEVDGDAVYEFYHDEFELESSSDIIIENGIKYQFNKYKRLMSPK